MSTIDGVPDLTEAQARRTRKEEGAIDVSALPEFAFGSRSTMWWGTMGFIVIESLTLVIIAFSLLYLRRNFNEWPPPRTPMPNLEIGTASLIVLLLSIIPAVMCYRASYREDLVAVRRAMLLGSAFALAFAVLRALELANLNTRWDEHAYGSLIWAIVFLHGTLLLVDVVEGWMETIFLYRGPVQRKHYSDFADAAIYWMFSAVAWIPLYVLVYLYPRWS
jgi:heme/copper-type cytochrome/quinol oxidase subunit 3